MDEAGIQTEKLKREVLLLRKQLAQSEARMLTCLVKTEAKILACQTEFAMFRDKIAKDMAARDAGRAALDDTVRNEFNAVWKRIRELEHVIVEIHQFLWPVVENIFPNLLSKCHELKKRFKGPGLYSEPKPH